MLSNTLEPIEGWPIGRHPLIKNLLKGIYNRNPPRPRYSHTWDVRIVLDYLKLLGQPKELDLMPLSCKTVMLVALATFFRVSDLRNIARSSIRFSESVSFSLMEPRKSQHSGALQSFELHRHPDSRQCPVLALKAYCHVTDRLRKSSGRDGLFLSCIRPHDPVSKTTIAGWLKKVLLEAGIDEGFSAHSTRAAASSKAVIEGVPVDTILRQASWANESTFSRFYRRDIV